MNENVSNAEKNDILIRSRKHIDITGVRDVVSFDDRTVMLVTSGGDLAVEGEDMKLGVLDTEKGVVSVDGKISAVVYLDNCPPRKKGLFGKGGR